ncbi:hypothetical protein [Burkholderia sp. F1]|uniref:hypothetical protein n=1 Tax=Burkholderia sp. F1 TaxID=3366817 RepID=UPI003D73A87B
MAAGCGDVPIDHHRDERAHGSGTAPCPAAAPYTALAVTPASGPPLTRLNRMLNG